MRHYELMLVVAEIDHDHAAQAEGRAGAVDARPFLEQPPGKRRGYLRRPVAESDVSAAVAVRPRNGNHLCAQREVRQLLTLSIKTLRTTEMAAR